jgi:hypothetical protein
MTAVPAPHRVRPPAVCVIAGFSPATHDLSAPDR